MIGLQHITHPHPQTLPRPPDSRLSLSDSFLCANLPMPYFFVYMSHTHTLTLSLSLFLTHTHIFVYMTHTHPF
jgi:hypothetical protein